MVIGRKGISGAHPHGRVAVNGHEVLGKNSGSSTSGAVEQPISDDFGKSGVLVGVRVPIAAASYSRVGVCERCVRASALVLHLLGDTRAERGR